MSEILFSSTDAGRVSSCLCFQNLRVSICYRKTEKKIQFSCSLMLQHLNRIFHRAVVWRVRLIIQEFGRVFKNAFSFSSLNTSIFNPPFPLLSFPPPEMKIEGERVFNAIHCIFQGLLILRPLEALYQTSLH